MVVCLIARTWWHCGTVSTEASWRSCCGSGRPAKEITAYSARVSAEGGLEVEVVGGEEDEEVDRGGGEDGEVGLEDMEGEDRDKLRRNL